MEDIRKFGLKHCDLPTILWNVTVLLRANSVNIDKNYKRIPWIFHLLNTISCGCYFYVYIFSMVWFSFIRCPRTGDYTAAVVEFCIAACSCTCTTKFVYMKLSSDTVINLVEDYLQCDSMIVPETRYASNVLKHLRVVKKRATTIWTALVANGIIYITASFVFPGRHLLEDLFVIYGLEPMFESPNYEIAKTAMILGVCFGVSILANVTVFIVVIVGYIEAKMLALSDELLNLWDDSKAFYEKYSTDADHINDNYLENKLRNAFIRNRLQDIIKFHIKCIDLKGYVLKELRFIFIVELVIMIISTVTELLGGLENTYMQMPYSFFQLFMACFVGQRLIDASNVFESSLYGCKWENFDVANRKTVLFMLRSSQKTLTLSAGGIVDLNFVCLMYAIKTTYSAYTTLKSTVK